MHDAGRMRLGESPGDLNGDVERHVDRQRSLGDPVAQRAAFVEGHREIQLSVIGLADVVDRVDVRMVERRGGLGFLDEAGLGGLVAGQVPRQELEGERAAEPRVEGMVDDAHAALADDRDELVRPDACARLELHGRNYCKGSSSNFTRVYRNCSPGAITR